MLLEESEFLKIKEAFVEQVLEYVLDVSAVHEALAERVQAA